MAWVDKTIGDLGLVVTGKTPSTKNRDFYNGGYLFVTPTDLDWDSYYVRKTRTTVSDEAKSILGNKFLPKNSVFFTCIASVGKMGIASEECLTNQQINSIIPNERFDSKFVYYLLRGYVQKIRSIGLSGGSAVPIINKSGFCKIRVRVPDNKKEQAEIGATLSHYDDLIENNRQRISLLEKSARLLYREWFSNTCAILPTKPLVKVANLTMGQSPASKYYNKHGDGLPFHQGATSYGARFVKNDVYTTQKTRIAMPGDILLSVRAPVGRINITQNKIVLGRGLAAINSKAGFNSFLFYALKSFFFKEDIIGTGSIYAAVTKSQLEKIEIFYPPEEKIKQFESAVIPIDRKIGNLYHQIQLLTNARDLLLPRLFDGTIKL